MLIFLPNSAGNAMGDRANEPCWFSLALPSRFKAIFSRDAKIWALCYAKEKMRFKAASERLTVRVHSALGQGWQKSLSDWKTRLMGLLWGEEAMGT